MAGRRGPLVLGYHGVGDVPGEHDPIELYMPTAAIRRHVELIRGRGYRLVTMAELADALGRSVPDAAGLAALTFDDGTEDHATVLPALLEELDAPGTVYVCPGLSGEPYPWTDAAAGIRFMTEDQLTELARHPLVEIGSHTERHTELHEADRETAAAELEACKSRLEQLLGRDVPSFCYPRCHFSPGAREAAAASGHTSAVTCGNLGSLDPFALRREVFHTSDGALITRLKLRSRYSGLGPGKPAKALRAAARLIDARLTPVGS